MIHSPFLRGISLTRVCISVLATPVERAGNSRRSNVETTRAVVHCRYGIREGRFEVETGSMTIIIED